jgi:serine/threonine protein kinase
MTVTSVRKAGAEAWTAPEVLDDAGTIPVPARDIYAFGCTLFQVGKHSLDAGIITFTTDADFHRKESFPGVSVQGMCLLADASESH